MSIVLFLCFVAFIVSGGRRERLGKLLRKGVERTWAFPTAQIPSNPEVSETAWRQTSVSDERGRGTLNNAHRVLLHTQETVKYTRPHGHTRVTFGSLENSSRLPFVLSLFISK